jgi:hypothetical protein
VAVLRATLLRPRIAGDAGAAAGDDAMKKHIVRFSILVAGFFLTAVVLASPVPGSAATTAGTGNTCRVEAASRLDQLLANAYPSRTRNAYTQDIDMRDDTGYNTDYLFAMTKAVASGPITPAVKPLLFLLTVPLDIITLPFTAIAGFF